MCIKTEQVTHYYNNYINITNLQYSSIMHLPKNNECLFLLSYPD